MTIPGFYDGVRELTPAEREQWEALCDGCGRCCLKKLADEANPQEGKISHESPLGKALMGKKVGDVVAYETPTGAELRAEIVSVG